ncbi:MAG: C45 family autoproteolytic acyltransferase/hydrolase [Candidatus Helarchaeota archaeon]
MKNIKRIILSKRGKTIILTAILLVAGFSFLSYWWVENDVSTENRVVDVWGIDPFTIGFQYGKACKKEIQGVCSQLGLIDGIFSLVSNIESVQLTLAVQPYIPQEYLIEMCGVAFGAGVTYNQIFFLNMMPDYMQLLEKTAFQCSQFIVVNNTNPLVGPMLGRTLDYPGDLALDRYQVIIRLHAYNGGEDHAIIGHTIAGMIGYLTGINEEGLTIGVSQISPWDIGLGISCTLAIRDVLQHNSTTQQASKTFGNYLQHTMGGWCLTVLDQYGSAAIVELSNTRNNTIWKPDSQPFLAVTNHFISPEMFGWSSHSLQSEARLKALLYLLPRYPMHDFATAISVLRSHYDSTFDAYFGDHRTVCNHGITPYHGTMGGFIGNPKHRLAIFCLGAPCQSDFYIITFDPINYLIGPVA